MSKNTTSSRAHEEAFLRTARRRLAKSAQRTKPKPERKRGVQLDNAEAVARQVWMHQSIVENKQQYPKTILKYMN